MKDKTGQSYISRTKETSQLHSTQEPEMAPELEKCFFPLLSRISLGQLAKLNKICELQITLRQCDLPDFDHFERESLFGREYTLKYSEVRGHCVFNFLSRRSEKEVIICIYRE